MRDTIVVSGTPRTGTTWVMELLSSLPDYKCIFEPLHPGWSPESRRYHFHPLRHYYLPNRRVEGRMVEYFIRIFTGNACINYFWRYPPWKYSRDIFFKRIFAKKIIVKFVSANRLLPWIHSNIRIRHIFIVFRDPFSTVASWYTSQFAGIGSEGKVYDKNVFDIFKRRSIQNALQIPIIRDKTNISKNIRKLYKPEELIALVWYLDYFVPLFYMDKEDFTLIDYKELLINRENILDMISSKINEFPLKRVNELSSKPSVTSLEDEIQDNQLNKWKQQVSIEQFDNVKNIIDMLNDELPHIDMLGRWNSLKY